MAFLGDLLIRLKADTADFQSDLGKAAREADRQFRKMQSAANALFGGVSAVGFTMFVKSSLDLGEELSKLSQKTGRTVEDLSKLRMAATLGDVEMEGFAKGLREFNRSLVEAGDPASRIAGTFRALGVDIKAGPAEAFNQFADAFAKLPANELRVSTATAIMKRSGEAWIPVLLEGREGLEKAGEQAERLGRVISTEFGQKAEQFNDNLKRIREASMALSLNIAKHAVEPLVTLTDNIVKANEEGKGLLGTLREILKLVVTTAAQMPKVSPWVPIIGPFSHMFTRQADAAAQALFESRLDGRDPARMSSGKIGGLAPPKGNTANPNAEALRRALANTDEKERARIAAEMKLYQSTIQSLEMQLGKLNHQTEEQKLLYQWTKGSLHSLTEEHIVHALNLSLEVDRKNALNEATKAEHERLIAVSDTMKQVNDLRMDFAAQDREQADQLQFNLGLLGKTAHEQEKLNAVRAIDLQVRERIAQVSALMPEDAIDATEVASRYREIGEAQKAAIITYLDQRRAAERDWVVGARRAASDYLDAITNAAERAGTFFANTFKRMEDALVDFVKTGKLDFKNLADSIITDIIRIQIQQSVMKPLVGEGGALSAGLGALWQKMGFGGGGGEAGLWDAVTAAGFTPYAVGTNYVPETGLALLHRGEKVIPAGGDDGGGARVTVINNLHADSRTDQATIYAMLQQTKHETIAAVLSQLSRNGATARAVRMAV